MTEDNNASEVLEGPTKAMNPAVEETGLQSSKGSLADSAISDPKGSTIVDSETNTHEPAKVPTAEEVKEPQIDASNDPGSVTQNDTHSEGKVDHTDATQADEPSKDEDCGGTKDASKRALEGQKWNNRDRGKGNFRKNVKSDLISQEESSDPVAIRKQVR
jgi:hypothetical protein